MIINYGAYRLSIINIILPTNIKPPFQTLTIRDLVLHCWTSIQCNYIWLTCFAMWFDSINSLFSIYGSLSICAHMFGLAMSSFVLNAREPRPNIVYIPTEHNNRQQQKNNTRKCWMRVENAVVVDLDRRISAKRETHI